MKKLIPIIALPIILFLSFFLIYIALPSPYSIEKGDNGVWDLRGFDFENYNAKLGGYAPFIPNALLTPSEFSKRQGETLLASPRGEQFLTSRLIVLVPNSGFFTFTRPSIDYSHRLYVNGEFLLEIGSPGTSRETDIPNTGHITFTAQAVDGVIEIVQQSSNFVHRRGGYHHNWYIGTGSALSNQARSIDMQTSILMGSFFSMFLLLLISYFLLRGNKGILYTALISLLWFVRIGVTSGRAFTVIMPFLDWHIKFRLEYITIPGAVILAFAIGDTVFPNVFNKIILRTLYAIKAAFILFYLFADTVLISYALIASYAVIAPSILYMAFCFAFKLRKTDSSQKMALIGISVFLAAAIVDPFYFTLDIIQIFNHELSGVAMLVFVLCMTAAVSIRTIENLEKTREVQNLLIIAEESSKAKSDFLASMSHEIRTPMNAIIGITQIRLQKNNISDEESEAFKKIYSSGRTLLGIINGMLDLSKIETGNLELIPVEYDVPSLINDTVQVNFVQLDSRPIELILEIDENLPSTLIGDDLRIKQILNNLLSNSVKYTESGFIKFAVRSKVTEELCELTFIIEDSGQGIKPEDMPKLFTAYSRFNLEDNRTIEGTGIGLKISEELIKMMDGSINVESTVGAGSIFTVTILQKTAGSPPIGSNLAKKLKSLSFKDERIGNLVAYESMPYGSVLIVDDVESNLFVAEGLLAPYDVTIETALSGFEALEKVRNGRVYDVIFMDHMMPKMDGIETTEKLRKMNYDGTIIALTANALKGSDDFFLSNGFDWFISKPIDIRQLDSAMTRFVRDKHPEKASTGMAFMPTQAKNRKKTKRQKLLKAFLHDANKALDKFASFKKSGDMELFVITAHSMKSALQNINEKNMSEIASSLETAGYENNMDFIDGCLDTFIKELEKLAEDLRENLEND